MDETQNRDRECRLSDDENWPCQWSIDSINDEKLRKPRCPEDCEHKELYETKPVDNPEEEPEEVIVLPIAKNLDKILTDTKVNLKGYVTYQMERYEVQYVRLPWARINQITTRALMETAETPSLEERYEQELIMDEMIKTIGGREFNESLKLEMDGEFGEQLRYFVFKSYGKNLVPEAMMGKLAEKLKNWLIQYLEDEGKLPKGKKRKSRSTGPNIPRL